MKNSIFCIWVEYTGVGFVYLLRTIWKLSNAIYFLYAIETNCNTEQQKTNIEYALSLYFG